MIYNTRFFARNALSPDFRRLLTQRSRETRIMGCPSQIGSGVSCVFRCAQSKMQKTQNAKNCVKRIWRRIQPFIPSVCFSCGWRQVLLVTTCSGLGAIRGHRTELLNSQTSNLPACGHEGLRRHAADYLNEFVDAKRFLKKCVGLFIICIGTDVFLGEPAHHHNA